MNLSLLPRWRMNARFQRKKLQLLLIYFLERFQMPLQRVIGLKFEGCALFLLKNMNPIKAGIPWPGKEFRLLLKGYHFLKLEKNWRNGWIINHYIFWHCIFMLPKIISIIFGLVAVGIFIWKFKSTPLCRPWIMLAVAGGVDSNPAGRAIRKNQSWKKKRW